MLDQNVRNTAVVWAAWAAWATWVVGQVRRRQDGQARGRVPGRGRRSITTLVGSNRTLMIGGNQDMTQMASENQKTEWKVDMTVKALRRNIINEKHVPPEGIVCVLPTHARGEGVDLLQEMVTQNEAGWAEYGATNSYHIVDVEKAKNFVKRNGGDLPFGFE